MIALPILLAWLLTDALATYGVLHHRRAFVPVEPPSHGPRTAVLIAVKGVSHSTRPFLDALRMQRYDNFRLIFALESSTDEAFALVTQLQRELAGHTSVDVVIAGTSSKRAQKVHNLLAALSALRVDDQIVVFADADIVPGQTWLSQLVRPVASGETAASCGYRWQLPVRRNWPSLIVAAADMSIATAARSRRWNLCWGGSVALDRKALDQLDLSAVWDRAASDDLTLTRALRTRSLRIYVPPFVLVASPVSHSWASLLGFMHRQYLLLRVYAPRHWLLAVCTLCIPALGAAIAIGLLLQRQWWALPFLGTSAALLQLRLLIRRSIAGRVLSAPDMAIATATVKFARWAWPLVHLVHLTALLSSGFGRRFWWAGIHYRLTGREVQVQKRGLNTFRA
jgi:cellulose synthase/poly-beta-1,6-N-acetylglucosamine synthase-like glycosyltransferase